jgi:hypothetical protein
VSESNPSTCVILAMVSLVVIAVIAMMAFYESPGLRWQRNGYREAVKQISSLNIRTVDGFRKWSNSEMCRAEGTINENRLPLAWQAEKDGEEFGNYQAGYLRVCFAVNQEINELEAFKRPDSEKVPEIMKAVNALADWY